MEYLDCYKFWLDAPLSEREKAELDAIKENDEEIKSRFGGELAFGTAGMRGVMGLGSNCLNRHTVRRAAQGMAQWLLGTDLPKKAAIGYDSRHNSELFAQVCAVAFAEQGITVFLYDRLAPTPMLSYAVRQLNCGCGIVVSASHNSGEYNGIKCYGPDGCQMTDKPAAVVTGLIQNIPYFIPEKKRFGKCVEEGLIQYIDQTLWERYYDTVIAESVRPQAIAESDIHVVYTPLCGTGNEPVRAVLDRLGANVHVVECQEKPDGDFKTCEYPNPETDVALCESYKVADTVPCDLILGTDPDCDRVAIAVPEAGGYRKLTGNELGCLLLNYILDARSKKKDIPDGAIVVKSVVTTPLADRIAAKYGVDMKTVLIGFKYIGGVILALEEKKEEEKFLFGFEESCGYLKGTYARDKDAVVASMLVCEMAAALKLEGKTILQALDALYETFGNYLAKVESVELKGVDAMEKAAALMTKLRNNTPGSIGGAPVTEVRDYKTGVAKNVLTGEERLLTLPNSNILEFVLGEFGGVIVRPSGTEPKVKFYYTAVGKTKASAEALLSAMAKQMAQ